ncbi:MAG: HK97-gp10 family putative phage morphogenesis protein [Candidatus Bathyarchaeia archaeon]|jgi:HK97 gp10 family phage protein
MSFSIQIISDTVTPKLMAAAQLMTKGIQDGLEEVGVEMEDTARQIVPVDTGFLQSTIYHNVDPANLSLEIGANADYAMFVELGTRRMAAEPYIRPAFDAHQDQLFQALLLGITSAFL